MCIFMHYRYYLHSLLYRLCGPVSSIDTGRGVLLEFLLHGL